METADFEEIFCKDKEGRYLGLVIPSLDGLPELDLRGKTDAELTPTEVSRKKMYVRELYRLMDDGR